MLVNVFYFSYLQHYKKGRALNIIELKNMENKIQKIEDLLNQKNIGYKIANYPPGVKNAAEAAELIGLPREKIIKSLVFKSKGEFMLLLLQSPKKVNVPKVNEELSLKISMASPEEIFEVTGYKIGAVTFFDLKTDLPVYIDAPVMECDKISVASGIRGIDIILDPKDLKTVAEGKILDLT